MWILPPPLNLSRGNPPRNHLVPSKCEYFFVVLVPYENRSTCRYSYFPYSQNLAKLLFVLVKQCLITCDRRAFFAAVRKHIELTKEILTSLNLCPVLVPFVISFIFLNVSFDFYIDVESMILLYMYIFLHIKKFK